MNLKWIVQSMSAVCVALLAAASVQAATVNAPISDLYNTGMATPWNAAQAPLPGSNPGVAVDPYWSVAFESGHVAGATPVGPTDSTKTLDDSTAPFIGNEFTRYEKDLATDPYAQAHGFTQLNDSQWIKENVPNYNSPPGIYVFSTTFTTSQPLTSISISGYFKSTDLLGIQLNGGPIIDPGSPHGVASEPTPSRPPRPFSITGTGGFVNTLRFYTNLPGTNLAAFRAEFTSATFTVPEPSTICLSVLGLVGFGAARLRRRFGGKGK